MFSLQSIREISIVLQMKYTSSLHPKNRNTRFTALKKLLNELPKETDDESRKKLFTNNLIKPLTYIFEDKVEKNREAGIKIAFAHIQKFGFSIECTPLLTTALSRLNGTPFPEPCNINNKQ